MAIGMLLLSRLDANTSALVVGLSMAVLGFGMGPMMSVATTATQNAIPRHQMGVATAGLTLFRQVGGSIGVAVFGALFSMRLNDSLAGVLPAGVTTDSLRGDMVAQLPPAIKETVLTAFTNALSPIFIIGAMVAIIGFFIALLLREVPLRSRDEMNPPPLSE